MKEEVEQLRAESRTMTLDPRDPLETAFVTEFHVLSLVTKGNLWIFDQKCQDDDEHNHFGQIVNYINLYRDKVFVIVAKQWKWGKGLREKIYEEIARQLSVDDIENLRVYLTNNDSPDWNDSVNDSNNFEEWGLRMKAREYLRIFALVCSYGHPLIQTRSLHVYDEKEINEVGMLRKGVIDPLMKCVSARLEDEEIPEHDENKIGNIVMIGECYHIRWKDYNQRGYIGLDVPFFLPITSDQCVIDSWKNVYNIGLMEGNVHGLQWQKVVRRCQMDLGGETVAEVFEMKICYDATLYHRFKEDVLGILCNDDCEDWRKQNNLTIFYGIEDKKKLLDIRKLKMVNLQQATKITDLQNYIHRLKDMIKKYEGIVRKPEESEQQHSLFSSQIPWFMQPEVFLLSTDDVVMNNIDKQVIDKQTSLQNLSTN